MFHASCIFHMDGNLKKMASKKRGSGKDEKEEMRN
jgi:hypothetical protein